MVKPVTPIDIGLEDLTTFDIFPNENLPIDAPVVFVGIPIVLVSMVHVIIPVIVLPPPTTPIVVIPATT